MSVLYCTIPYFEAALARRDQALLANQPLVLVGPEGRVFGASAEAAACGIIAGMTAHAAQVRCPEGHLLDVDPARYRAEAEILFQVLETASSRVEPHGWGAAYAELGDLKRESDVVITLQQVGQTIRHELGSALQPALGWDSSKFTAQAAARLTSPGRLRVVTGDRQRGFLQPLTITLLPLPTDTLRRLGFLGLRTLGQYANLPRAAVGQQFGPAGLLAHRCARGEDDRPIAARWQASRLAAQIEFETPFAERERLLAALRHLVSPLLTRLQNRLQACGQVRLVAHFDDGTIQERERVFLFPIAGEQRVSETLAQLLDRMQWQSLASGLAVTLDQIQDTMPEQLTLFPLEDKRVSKLQEVSHYLAARFGANCLRRAVLAQPGAPLPEWRTGWLDEGKP